MRTGDIVRNPWVSTDMITAYFIFLKSGKRYAQTLQLTDQGTLEMVLYLASDLKPTAERQFKVVGHTQIFKTFEKELIDIAKQEEKVNE
ncbi:hypothetical protein IWT140_01732 [Secundilactobacillus pentosiphilus]|uniref:Uncharacterized protein n=1 Tax=Secundilactobacillus pentosiphilus TaxID=1714682 RepID=A0A1Z5IQP8_9LACO|nr:hypothetical protein [Secundilactobacillus pentosiphilus]GAX04095.1 hypothetical protein IWT140_01732 [Secundilactobacillus pentosiphilus]